MPAARAGLCNLERLFRDLRLVDSARYLETFGVISHGNVFVVVLLSGGDQVGDRAGAVAPSGMHV